MPILTDGIVIVVYHRSTVACLCPFKYGTPHASGLLRSQLLLISISKNQELTIDQANYQAL